MIYCMICDICLGLNLGTVIYYNIYNVSLILFPYFNIYYAYQHFLCIPYFMSFYPSLRHLNKVKHM